jgi:hypothetical protein
MIELSIVVWVLAGFFAYVGWERGFMKEVISLSGITLALFGLYEFDTLIRVTLFDDLNTAAVYYIQATLFGLVVFFAYQTRELDDGRSSRRADRDEAQTKALGGIVGFINGYMVGGTLWYLLDIANYPLSPRVAAPAPGSPSAEMVSNLPLYVLGAGEGNLLALMVVLLFIVVLVII